MSFPSMRLAGLLRKEFLQIMRDPSALAVAFLLPAFLLLIFGYGVTLDARDVPIAVVIDHPDALTTSFTSHLNHSSYFVPHTYPSIGTAEDAMKRDDVRAIVWLREDFARRILAGDSASLGIMVNGTDANSARILEGYLQQTWSIWIRSLARDRGSPFSAPIRVEQSIRFNPAVSSRDYLIPGLIAVIMTLTGALLTALVMAREWERGTLEALMVTQATIREILLAKLLPYFALGMGGMMASLIIAITLFHVPFQGSLLVLTGASSLFLLAALGMGLLISSLARNQFVAGQIAIIATFLPAFILSGFIFDIGSMPAPIRILTHAVAARYFVSILQTLFLAGDVWSVILPNALALALMAILFLFVARINARKRLD